MTLALLYDVHGNLPALEAVLADADAAGARRFLLGGDYALFGPWPAETVARLDALHGATWIRGNGERWTADPTQAPLPPVQDAARACAAALGPETTARLAALPPEAVLDGIRCVHGTPGSDLIGLLPQPAEDEEELLAEVRERRLVAGHTHLPLERRARRSRGASRPRASTPTWPSASATPPSAVIWRDGARFPTVPSASA